MEKNVLFLEDHYIEPGQTKNIQTCKSTCTGNSGSQPIINMQCIIICVFFAGLIVGAIIRYASPNQQQSYAVVMANNSSISTEYYNDPPDLLKLKTNKMNSSRFYEYTFSKRISTNVDVTVTQELSEKVKLCFNSK